jgi:hypothetical protein
MIWSRVSSVSIETGYALDFPGSILGRARVFSSPHRPDRLWGTDPSIQWVPGALFLVAKRPGRQPDHSLPSSADVKNGGAIPRLPHTSS